MDDQIYELINSLSRLINFDVSFIDNNHVFLGDDSFFEYLQQKISCKIQHLNKLLVFPFIVNNHSAGHFVIKTRGMLSKKQVNLIRLILSGSSATIPINNFEANVLYPLTGQKLKDFLFILKNTKLSKRKGVTPPPRNLSNCLLKLLQILQMPCHILTKTYLNH